MAPYDVMEFAAKLTKLLGNCPLPKSKVAKKAGLSQSTLSKMAGGLRRPYLDQGLKIARALDVSVEYLADDGMDEPPLGLTEDQQELLRLAERVGYPLALKRVVAAAEVETPPGRETWGTNRPGRNAKGPG